MPLGRKPSNNQTYLCKLRKKPSNQAWQENSISPQIAPSTTRKYRHGKSQVLQPEFQPLISQRPTRIWFHILSSEWYANLKDWYPRILAPLASRIWNYICCSCHQNEYVFCGSWAYHHIYFLTAPSMHGSSHIIYHTSWSLYIPEHSYFSVYGPGFDSLMLTRIFPPLESREWSLPQAADISEAFGDTLASISS